MSQPRAGPPCPRRPASYRARVPPPPSSPLRLAVVGAGLAGLVCAQRAARAGWSVTAFEKARGVGGRLSTRRHGELHFDHGAQYFTARDAEFVRFVQEAVAGGVAAPWSGRVGTLSAGGIAPETAAPARFVGTPGMSAFVKPLAEGIVLRTGVRVGAVARDGAGWRLESTEGDALGRYDAVAVAAPAPQAAPLLAAAPALAARAASVPMRPCWAGLVAFEKPLALAARLDAAFVEGAPLAWIARNGSKPGRPPGESWVLHAAPAWSEAHVDATPDDVARELVAALGDVLGQALPAPLHRSAHRWLYALPAGAAASPGDPCLWDPALRLGACGDWCLEGRVEAAFRSGAALAARLGPA